MFLFNVNIVKDERVSLRSHARIMRMVAYLLGLYHKMSNVPKHFSGGPETTPFAGGYGYRPRSKKYLAWKAKKFPGRPLLVATGALQAAAAAGSVTATQHKWTYRARSPHSPKAGGNILREQSDGRRRRGDTRPLLDWIRAEVEVVSDKEMRFLIRKAGTDYARLANKPFYHTRRRASLG
jgi:hypothetical protein